MTLLLLVYKECAGCLLIFATRYSAVFVWVVAIRTDAGEKRTNRKTFFNSMVAAYTGWNDCRNIGEKSVLTGDGEPLRPDFMSDAVNIMNEIRVCSRWQEGDVILVDNRTAMHSRSPYEGKRRVLAALARDPDR